MTLQSPLLTFYKVDFQRLLKGKISQANHERAHKSVAEMRSSIVANPNVCELNIERTDRTERISYHRTARTDQF